LLCFYWSRLGSPTVVLTPPTPPPPPPPPLPSSLPVSFAQALSEREDEGEVIDYGTQAALVYMGLYYALHPVPVQDDVVIFDAVMFAIEDKIRRTPEGKAAIRGRRERARAEFRVQFALAAYKYGEIDTANPEEAYEYVLFPPPLHPPLPLR
jgi:hypothetical protein